jgi:hypothetical protein
VDVLKKLLEPLVKTRWGQVILGVLAVLGIATASVSASSTEAQAFGYGSLGVVLLAAAALAPRVYAWLLSLIGGGKPPAAPGGAV